MLNIRILPTLALTEIFKRKRNTRYKVYKLIADKTVGINCIVKQTTIENPKNALEKATEWVASAFAFNELSIFVLETNIQEKKVGNQ